MEPSQELTTAGRTMGMAEDADANVTAVEKIVGGFEHYHS